MTCRSALVGLFVLAGAPGASPARAQVLPPPSSLPTIEESFALRVGDPNSCLPFYCFNGADFDRDTLAALGGTYTGIYVFVRGSAGAWSQQAVLLNPDPTPNFPVEPPNPRDPATGDYSFGHPFVLKDNEIFAAAVFYDNATRVPRPQVFVFQRRGTAWTHRQTIVPPPGAARIDSLALHGGTALISAGGRVYVFSRAPDRSYRLSAELVTGADTSPLGASVALDGRTALVSTGLGSVYVFERRNFRWRRTLELASIAGGPITALGGSLDVDGDHIAVGVSGTASDIRPGAVRTFVRTEGRWRPEQIIENPIPIDGDGNVRIFGTTLDLDGSRLLVGGDTFYPFAPSIPMTYLFKLQDDGWTASARLSSGNPRLVRISGDSALVDPKGLRGGTYPVIFDIPPTPFSCANRSTEEVGQTAGEGDGETAGAQVE